MDVALAESTKDSDLVLDPRALANSPRLEVLMRGAGFDLDRNWPQPGSWVSPSGIPVDLMVPEALAGAGGRRGARIPPHSKRAARRTVGLEAAVVDHTPMRIGALTSRDERVYMVNVAGPAALLVAKLHKIAERADMPDRLIDKDAHDLYRLLVAIPTATLAAALGALQADPLAQARSHAARSGNSMSYSPPVRMLSDQVWPDEPSLISETQPTSPQPRQCSRLT